MNKLKIFKIKVIDVDNTSANSINRFMSDRFYSALFFNILFILCIYASDYIKMNKFIALPVFYILFNIVVCYLVNKHIIKEHYILLYYLVNMLPSFFIFLFIISKLLSAGYLMILLLLLLIYIFGHVYFSKKNWGNIKQTKNVNLIKYIGVVLGGVIGVLSYNLDSEVYILLIIFILFNLIFIQIKYEIKYVLKNDKYYKH